MNTRSLTFTVASLFAAGALGLAAVAQQETRQPPRPTDQQGQPGGPGGGGRQGGGQGRQPGGPGGQGERQANVEGVMKGINRAYKAMEKSIDDAASKDENLKHINDLQRNVVIAKGLTPKTDKVAADKKAEHLKAYRTTQIELIKLLLTLEEQTLEGKTKDARATYDKIGKFEEDAHKKFAD
ncbi:MAG: cytochrome b562 [Phycisphaerales bacterium]